MAIRWGAVVAYGSPVPQPPDLFALRATAFVLWRPAQTVPAPVLVIGTYAAGDPPQLAAPRRITLAADPARPGVWSVSLADCALADGVYHYWFELADSSPYRAGSVIQVTDPLAAVADWRLMSPALPPPYDDTDRSPAAVIKVSGGRLVPGDPGGLEPDWSGDAPVSGLTPNIGMVIYELPTQWTKAVTENGTETADGTLADVLALVSEAAAAPSFPDIPELAAGRSYLAELGVTTLELLPVADSCLTAGWKYGTSNYLAPDHTLGQPPGLPAPVAATLMAELVSACHRAGLRFFLDAVMGFGRQDAYRHVNYPEFHVVWRQPGDPDTDPEQGDRQGWGGDLWRYATPVPGYDPVTGTAGDIYPARQHMLMFIARWLLDQRIDGIRIDSVDTVASWDFVGEFWQYARGLFRARAAAQGVTGQDAEDRFLVVGEYLDMPHGLVGQRLDALWNDEFKYALRAALLGQVRDGQPDFAATVREMVDCRLVCDFTDGAQAVNYITSHDVGNWNSQRLQDYLNANGVTDTEPRIKLAYACLLTAVGIPMIFAGEEFADQHDLPLDSDSGKETDPVNFSRLADDWRQRIFGYVANLVRFRRTAPALAVNDTAFIHTDLTPGRRVFAWQRGPASDPVVVVANFSDWQTPNPADPASEYVIAGWPAAPAGRHWHEVTQDRDIPDDWAGREPLYPWEAKVYALA
jgi:pullulanase